MSGPGSSSPRAAEWLLDNFHLVTSEIRDIHQHLPGAYYRQLPTLASREQAGHTRIYAMAVELVRHSDSRIDRQQLAVFVNSYQRVAPLTIGELWAWPSMLKLALIENLRRLAAETLESRRARLAADAYVARIEREAGDTGRRPLAVSPRTSPLSSSSCIGSASTAFACRRSERRSRSTSRRRRRRRKRRFAANTSGRRPTRCRWPMPSPACASVPHSIGASIVESVSLVEQVLQRDPAGAYGRMDFLSRDRQRQAVEELAAPSGDAQVRVALRAVESARQAAAKGSPADRAAHVGYHLIDKGRRDLEVDVAYRPRLASRVRRLVFAHATLLYLGPIAVLTAALLTGSAAYARYEGASARAVAALVLLLADARRPTSRSRSLNASSPGRSRLAACLASTSPTVFRTTPARWSSCPRC